MADYSDEEIEQTLITSNTEQLANLNQVVISQRAQIVLLEKRLKDVDDRRKGLDLALERVSGVDKVILQLQKEVKYYEENVDLVWRRRIRPEKLIKDKAKAVKKDKSPSLIVNPVNDLLKMKKNYDVDTERHETKIDNLMKQNSMLAKELNELREDNDKMPIPQSLQKELTEKIEDYETRLKRLHESKDFYMKLCYASKDIDNSIIINKETENSPRKGLSQVLKAK